MDHVTEGNLAERLKNLPADKVDLLLRRLKPGRRSQETGREGNSALRPFVESRDQNFELIVENPGTFDSLKFVAQPRLPPEDDQVEVEVESACLNFRDVALALGIYPRPEYGFMPKFGCNGAGRVSAVGSGVTHFKVGDEVFFLSAESSFARYTRLPHMAAFHKPPSWRFEEAAGLALPFMTAFFALLVPGRLNQGEQILIHCAAGGVGLAAIQLARTIGAEIIATAGTEEKKSYLHGLGIRHVLDSRSLEFAERIVELTGGYGVDVILNSIPGQALEAGFRILRNDGRFLEIGKRDLVAGRVLDLAPFSRSLTFAAIDIFGFDFKRLHPIVLEIRQAVADGKIQPLPITTYKASQLIDAFRYMTAGKHIGRIVVQMKGEQILLATPHAT
jgi:NADPH:quinone reductase-like Zn-dependent oxidoreductase